MYNDKFPSESGNSPISLESGCTQAMATGLTSLVGNMNGQCVDSPITYWPGFLKLVTPPQGNRYLTVGDGGIFALMNEKGIILSAAGRLSRPFPPYAGQHKYPTKGDLLTTCNSAAE